MSTFSSINTRIGKSFDTIADLASLRAYRPRDINDGDTILMTSKITIGDGLGGAYAWIEDSVEADDNDRVIKPDMVTTAGRWVKMFGKGDRGATGPSDADFEGPEGASLVGAQADGSTRNITVAERLADFVSVMAYIPANERRAIRNGTSTYDATADIQKALDANRKVYFPKGVYRVNAVTGIRMSSGQNIVGDGLNSTVFYALPGGGSTAQLANYGPGSIFRRNFNPSVSTFGDNPYITNILISDIAVVLNHPNTEITSSAVQIGIDLRNITRSRVQRCHVGNLAPLGLPNLKPGLGAYSVQGYGIVIGTMGSSDPAYSGGEVNAIISTAVWHAYKGITQDDGDLSPLSGAHATIVKDCDIQGCHMLLVQESRYTAGGSWSGNTLQDVRAQVGNANSKFVMRIAGYNLEALPGYVEAGAVADFFLYLDPLSRSNNVTFIHATATNNYCQYYDGGSNNIVTYRRNTGSIPGGIDSSGDETTMRNRAMDPLVYAEQEFTGDNQVLLPVARSLNIGGGGAPRTGITIGNGLFSGQQIVIVANSWSFTFAPAAAKFSTATPPTMGDAPGQVSTLTLVWTISGWFEASRSTRPV